MKTKIYLIVMWVLMSVLIPFAGAGAFNWQGLDLGGQDGPLADTLGRLDAGEWGYKMFPLLAEEMWDKNVNRGQKKPRALTAWQKKYLAPWLKRWGLEPDALQIVYSAALVNNYKIMDKWPITIMDEYAGQTFGNVIYIQQPYKKRNGSLLILLSHEAYHAKQCQELGSIAEFGRQYTLGFVEAFFSYENNPFEKEAYAAEARFKKWLCSQEGWRCK